MTESPLRRVSLFVAVSAVFALAFATLPAQAGEMHTAQAGEMHTAQAGEMHTAQAPEEQAERCVDDPATAARRGDLHRDASLPAATVRAFERDLAEVLGLPDRAGSDALRREARQRASATGPIEVRVRAHVISPRKGENVMSRKKVRRQIRVMNKAYRGRQADRAYDTRVRFSLQGIDRTAKRSWYHAGMGTQASKAMRRELHRGGPRTLNIYFNSPRTDYGTVLGYSTFPQEVRKHPKLDGVVVNIATMKRKYGPKHYRSGDTGVHETGHWLGLYHTFQGGCGKRNDRVKDTPRERDANYRCPKHRDSCTAPGRDPVHNFMDYSYDRCMNRFTKGQSERINLHWAAYRD